jgi:adenosylcobinamide kinase/adenosylcobinamide-phosphate guanylyltransferase
VTLCLITGPARSGKSTLGVRLALATGRAVTVAVAGRAEDAEMAARIERHRAERPEGWTTLELTPAMLAGDPTAWLAAVPAADTLLVDCLGTLLGAVMEAAFAGDFGEDALADPAAQERFEDACAVVTAALAGRGGDLIVVSNETAWGVIPAHGSGRLHRDELGRATRTLTDAADRAWLVVAGRAIDLADLPRTEEISL